MTFPTVCIAVGSRKEWSLTISDQGGHRAATRAARVFVRRCLALRRSRAGAPPDSNGATTAVCAASEGARRRGGQRPHGSDGRRRSPGGDPLHPDRESRAGFARSRDTRLDFENDSSSLAVRARDTAVVGRVVSDWEWQRDASGHGRAGDFDSGTGFHPLRYAGRRRARRPRSARSARATRVRNECDELRQLQHLRTGPDLLDRGLERGIRHPLAGSEADRGSDRRVPRTVVGVDLRIRIERRSDRSALRHRAWTRVDRRIRLPLRAHARRSASIGAESGSGDTRVPIGSSTDRRG